MAWRLARSLEVLRSEVNKLAPDRSKISDGTLGDQAHASRASRHNPNFDGVVCALDITNDVANGCPIHIIARRIALHPHPDLWHIISDGEIAKRSTGFRWEPYRGENEHRRHAHFGVGVGPDSDPRPPYDDLTPWGVGGVDHIEEDDLTPEQAEKLDNVWAVLCDPKDTKYLDKRLASVVRDPLAALARRLAVKLGFTTRPDDPGGV